MIALALAAAGWAWMIAEMIVHRRATCCPATASVCADAIGWCAMVAAMMLPTTLESIAALAARSYRARRTRAQVGYIAGYVLPWLAVGALAVVGRALHAPAVAFALIGAAWAFAPARARWFAQCHRQIAVCPVGPRADLDAVRQGLANGSPCVAMCWPLMIACALAGHPLALMLGGAVLGAYEKRMFRLARFPIAAAHVALAAWLVVC